MFSNFWQFLGIMYLGAFCHEGKPKKLNQHKITNFLYRTHKDLFLKEDKIWLLLNNLLILKIAFPILKTAQKHFVIQHKLFL